MKKVLIVDDDLDILMTLKDALELEGKYTVLTVSDPRAAIVAALEFMPDIMILDVMMPDKDGGQLAAEMRENSDLRGIPIVFQTAVMTREEESHNKEYAERERILVKPVSIDKITETIDRLT